MSETLDHVLYDKLHDLWWRPKSRGYTNQLLCAGLYTKEAAERTAELSKGDTIAMPMQAAIQKMLERSGNTAESIIGEFAIVPKELAAIQLELLASCKAFDKWFDGWCPNSQCCAHSGLPIQKQARAAIAKAEAT